MCPAASSSDHFSFPNPQVGCHGIIAIALLMYGVRWVSQNSIQCSLEHFQVRGLLLHQVRLVRVPFWGPGSLHLLLSSGCKWSWTYSITMTITWEYSIAVTTVINVLRSGRRRREFVYYLLFIRSSLHPIISDTLVTGLEYSSDGSFQVGAAEFAKAHAPPGASKLSELFFTLRAR